MLWYFPRSVCCTSARSDRIDWCDLYRQLLLASSRERCTSVAICIGSIGATVRRGCWRRISCCRAVPRSGWDPAVRPAWTCSRNFACRRTGVAICIGSTGATEAECVTQLSQKSSRPGSRESDQQQDQPEADDETIEGLPARAGAVGSRVPRDIGGDGCGSPRMVCPCSLCCRCYNSSTPQPSVCRVTVTDTNMDTKGRTATR